jgi:GTPase SAR1 family protein
MQLEMWDTAGMEKYRCLAQMYLRGADGVLLVYDVTNRESFDCIGEFKTSAQTYAPSRILIVMTILVRPLQR